MILQIAPDAPALVKAAATTALILHVGGGLMAIASGWVAMAAKKGGRNHRVAGTVFFVSMLSMAGVGAIVSPMLPEAQWANTTAAIFTLYLVLTGWMAVQRPAGQVGRFESAAIAMPVGIITLAAVVAMLPAGVGPAKAEVVLIFALSVFSALAAWRDLAIVRRGGLRGAPRTARHLVRLGAAFFVANGSFFLGQPTHVPQVLKDLGLNVAIPLAAIAVTLFWLVRTLRPRLPRFARPTAAAA
jgi:uncharacterized membrane protein